MKSEKEISDYLAEILVDLDSNGKYMDEHEYIIMQIQIETLEYCLDKWITYNATNVVQGTGQECWQTVQSARASIAIPVTGTMPVAHEMSGMWQHTKKNKCHRWNQALEPTLSSSDTDKIEQATLGIYITNKLLQDC